MLRLTGRFSYMNGEQKMYGKCRFSYSNHMEHLTDPCIKEGCKEGASQTWIISQVFSGVT